MATILPNGKVQFSDQNGRPLVGGQVFYYEPETETKLDTWQDAELTIPNENPITLDARGQATIWGNSSYRQLVKDKSGSVIWDEIISAAVSFADLSNGSASELITFGGESLSTLFSSRLNRVVDSIAELRAIDHTVFTRAFATGYRGPADGGGGPFQYDPDDTSSLDDGFTVIVATDGARWKLQITGPVSSKQAGAVGDGVSDDTVAIRAFFNTVIAKGYGGYLDVGTYKCTAALALDISANSRLGFVIDGAGSQRAVLDLTSVSSGVPFQILDSSGSASGDGFYYALKNFGIKTSIAGVGVALGQENFSDAMNSFIIDNVVINNASTGSAACAFEINYVLASQINVVANCAGAGDAIRCRQMQFSRLTGAGGTATNGLRFTGGYSFGNNIDNIDLEVVAYCVTIDVATASHNNFHGGQLVWTSGGINATAGNNNTFYNANFGLSTNKVVNSTGVIVVGDGYGSLQLGGLNVSPASGDGAVAIDSVTANGASFVFRRAGSTRWSVQRNNATESGSNVGSNLLVTRYSDAGASIDNPVAIDRGTGNVTVLRLAASAVGFFGAGITTTRPVVSGSRASGAALTSLIGALSSLGLITDSTTA